MENSGTAEIQVNPPLEPATATVVAQPKPETAAENHYHICNYGDPNYNFYYSQSQSQNPNPYPDPHHHYHSGSVATEQIQPPPPGLDVAPLAMIPPSNYYVSASGYEAATQVVLAYSSAEQTTSTGVHHAVALLGYQDPNQNVVNLPAPGVAVPSSGLHNLVTSQRTKTSKKSLKKVNKVVQSVWCEVCKVDCNSKFVLDQHKLGKKHKKNLQKLILLANPKLASPSPVSAPYVTPASTIGPQENPVKEKLETKRMKMLEGGAAADAVRMCAICNVVCNSETVFATHLAGQKHAAKLKKHAKATNAVHT